MIPARFHTITAAAFMVAFVAACDHHDPVAPTGENAVLAKTNTPTDTSTGTGSGPTKPGPGTPSDTALHPPTPTPTTPPPDSGTSSYNGPVTISGHVLSTHFVTPAGASGDTISTSPLQGATLTLVALSIEGQPTGGTVATATTDASGAFTIPSVPASGYRLSVTPPTGSGLATAFYNFMARQPTVSVNFQLPVAH